MDQNKRSYKKLGVNLEKWTEAIKFRIKRVKEKRQFLDILDIHNKTAFNHLPISLIKYYGPRLIECILE